MGLGDWIERQGFKVWLGKTLKENPGMLAWLNSHKAGFGLAFVLAGIMLGACDDPRCKRIDKYLDVAGAVLVASGVLKSDYHAQQDALQAKFAPYIPAIKLAMPAAEEIAAMINAETHKKLVMEPDVVGGRRKSDPPAPGATPPAGA